MTDSVGARIRKPYETKMIPPTPKSNHETVTGDVFQNPVSGTPMHDAELGLVSPKPDFGKRPRPDTMGAGSGMGSFGDRLRREREI